MNFPKINMFLLIVVIIIAAVILYFVFMNKKGMSRQDDALARILGQLVDEDGETAGQQPVEQPVNSQLNSRAASTEEITNPTEKEWRLIYSAADILYAGLVLPENEAAIRRKFPVLVDSEIQYLKVLYPVCDKLEKGETLDGDDKIFYEANRQIIDDEINYRREQFAAAAKTVENQVEQPVGSRSASGENPDPGAPNPELVRANPPLTAEHRTQTILSFFTDGVPKTVKMLTDLFKTATGKDYGKNMHRVLGGLEGKFLTPIKVKNTTYYCMPEWFDGRKLKPEYKNKIAA